MCLRVTPTLSMHTIINDLDHAAMQHIHALEQPMKSASSVPLTLMRLQDITLVVSKCQSLVFSSKALHLGLSLRIDSMCIEMILQHEVDYFIAERIDEQTPLLHQGDAMEKAIYLGVDADGNRIFMARPGMRLAILEDPPSDAPSSFFSKALSQDVSSCSLLEALRNSTLSPLYHETPASIPSAPITNLGVKANALQPVLDDTTSCSVHTQAISGGVSCRILFCTL